MRKWIHAGLVAGGLLLPGAPPAPAGVVPAVLTSPAGSARPGPATGAGLTVDGQVAGVAVPRESALSGGVALLGGLSGLGGLPPAGDPAPTRAGGGLPPGGSPVDPALVDPVDHQATGGPGTPPVTTRPTTSRPRPAAEPTADEKRTFSPGGRPIAGEDEDFR